jgi:hypothetical protein
VLMLVVMNLYVLLSEVCVHSWFCDLTVFIIFLLNEVNPVAYCYLHKTVCHKVLFSYVNIL